MIDYVDSIFDVRITPMKEIEEFLQENYRLEDSEMRCITSGILRKKRILKRERAKFRTRDMGIVKVEPNFVPSVVTPGIIDLTCDESEKKKKRNRISAQISRDRKKQYLIDLESENRKLQ